MAEHRLAPGDVAPDFSLPDADGAKVSLSDYRGQRVIIYFYPAAMTPGCTKQACDFRDSLSSLSAAGLIVLGISPDGPAKLARFRDKEGLNFPLLSDQDRCGRRPVHLRRRPGREAGAGSVRRQGDRPRGQAAQGARRLSEGP